MPPRVKTIEEQETDTYALYQSKTSRIERRHFLMEVFNANRTLFFYLMEKHITEMMPIVYDPVIAESIEKYNERYFVLKTLFTSPLSIRKTSSKAFKMLVLIVTFA